MGISFRAPINAVDKRLVHAYKEHENDEKGGISYNEGKIVSKTYLRKVQSNQEKRWCSYYLREPETQTETGLIHKD